MTHQEALTQCLALAITAPDDRVDAAVTLSMELAELCTPLEVARAKKIVEGQIARSGSKSASITTTAPSGAPYRRTEMKTFYANSIEGCVLCGPDDLPEGGNWIVSDNADNVIGWLHECGQDREYFKVSNEVLIEVASEFGFLRGQTGDIK